MWTTSNTPDFGPENTANDLGMPGAVMSLPSMIMRRTLEEEDEQEREHEWYRHWSYVQWVFLSLALCASLFHLVSSLAMYRGKRRVADMLLCVIALSDFVFSGLGMWQKAAGFLMIEEFDSSSSTFPDHKASSPLEWISCAVSRGAFFMSLFWVTNLSILIRAGKIEGIHLQASHIFAGFLAMGYGSMYATLPAITDTFAYLTNAVLLLAVQVTLLLTIAFNICRVHRSRLGRVSQGKSVIRRLVSYCCSFVVFGLPYSIALLFVQDGISFGIVAQSFTSLVPLMNALLFGTSMQCLSRIERKTGGMSKRSGAGTNSSAPNRSGGIDSEALLGPTAEMTPQSEVIKIGEGSSAIVYKAQWLGITVAMKCMRLPVTDGVEDLYRTHLAQIKSTFREEAILAAQLRHPNITLFIKLGTYNGAMCLVNEYCARGSLREVLQANPLMEWSTKVRLAFEASRGLAFMHNRDPIYLHRDLKASNILVTEDWTAKIADFGICRIASDMCVCAPSQFDGMISNNGTDLTTFAGTWRWNAPEVMLDPNNCRFNRKTDIYSFGMALWEILSNGATPFDDIQFDHQVRELVASGARPEVPDTFPNGTPPAFVEIIRACWDQDPENRPTAQDVMLQLGSLSYSLQKEAANNMSTARQAFSDNYYYAVDSSRSTVYMPMTTEESG